ncbi:acyltransferase family protein [Brachybacterium sp. AOP43-C2-M15]|uniref:acyltransferase family protein n=1 Tax=Brachybacterium sp. AOP43-C2-M15 TaxID=3457661 RepID=UPI00403371A4
MSDGAPTSPSAAPPAARRARDPYLDNARGILIVLVVVGHTIECFAVEQNWIADGVRVWIYTFHMAAFVAISGHLSRSYRNEPRQVKRLLTAMAVPYLIFQTVHEVGKTLLLGQQFQLQVFLPAWTLWFLLALLLWRLATPVLRQLRYPLVFAVAISVITPLDPDLDSLFTLGRLVGMLPFFVLGLVTTPAVLARIRAFPHRWAGAAVLLGALVCAVALRDHVRASHFFLREAYPEDTGALWDMGLRLAVLVVGAIGTLALLVVSPRGTSVLTVLGRRSLTIYLLHPVLLLPIRYGEGPPAWLISWWGSLVVIGAGLLLTAALSTGIVSRLTRWLTDPPIGDQLVRDETREQVPPHRV